MCMCINSFYSLGYLFILATILKCKDMHAHLHVFICIYMHMCINYASNLFSKHRFRIVFYASERCYTIRTLKEKYSLS